MSDLRVVIDPSERTDVEPPGVAIRRRRDPEQGFSLIELIIVIVILGILVAIAIPIYNNIQNNAKDNALKTAAANGASQAVAQLANDPSATPDLSNLQSGDVKSVTVAQGSTPEDICVKATDGDGGRPDQYAGPGATSDGTGCKTAPAS